MKRFVAIFGLVAISGAAWVGTAVRPGKFVSGAAAGLEVAAWSCEFASGTAGLEVTVWTG
jgi:hypothetical protein